MMKRIFAVVLVVLLLVPSFAVVGARNVPTRRLPVGFNEFDIFIAGDSADNYYYPIKLGIIQETREQYYNDGTNTREYWTDNTVFNANGLYMDVWFAVGQAFDGIELSLFNRNFVIGTADLIDSEMLVSCPDVVPDDNVTYTLSGNIATFVLDSGKWVEREVPFSVTYTGTGTFDVASRLYGAVPIAYRNTSYLRFTNLLLRISTPYSGNALRVRVSTSGPNYLAGYPTTDQWIRQYNLSATNVTIPPSNPDDVSFTDWLVVAIGSFLDFELWPGFSLDQMLLFVLAIGVVITICTLLI